MSPRIHTDESTFCAAASDADAARVPVEVRTTVADPFDAYRRARDGPGGFYLETTGGQDGWGYFGVAPADRLTVTPYVVSRDGGSDAARSGATAGPGATGSPAIDELVARLDRAELVRAGCDVPYPCGAVGWLSYDVTRDLEDLPDSADRDRALPRLQVGVYGCLAAWEEPRPGSAGAGGAGGGSRDGGADTGSTAGEPGDSETTLRVTACPRVDTFADPTDAYEHGRDRALALARSALEGDPAVGPPPVDADEARFESDCGRAAFAERVRRVKAYIREGDTFQANVSQRLRAPAAVHPVAAYDALRAVNPAPYSGLLEFPGVDLVSASPELLLEREPVAGSGNRSNLDQSARAGTSPDSASAAGARLVTEPIAGTRPRGGTDAEDADLERDLVADEKERAEHAMLVDLERNDLGKVSEYGSVEVSEYRRVDRYSEVMHLVSLVEGRQRPGSGLGEAVAAVFPGGTITGAPKPRTMAIIDEVERTRRGPYTGSVGLFGFDGRATLNIVIRTLVRYGSEYHLRVGAGVVHDSVPDREYEETLDKGRALVTAVDEALGDRAAFTVEGSE
jgi:anthranilate synthase component 1